MEIKNIDVINLNFIFRIKLYNGYNYTISKKYIR